MRRSELKRSKGLAADPEKTREWERRSRERAAAEQRAPNLAVPDAERFGRPGKKRVTFRAESPARTQRCFACGCAAHAWHHWLAQQHIRVYVHGLRMPDEAVERRLLYGLLRDERNLSAVCAACHDSHEAPGVGSDRFAAEDVPGSAHEFAAELGAEWAEKLRRSYPTRAGGLPASSHEED